MKEKSFFDMFVCRFYKTSIFVLHFKSYNRGFIVELKCGAYLHVLLILTIPVINFLETVKAKYHH